MLRDRDNTPRKYSEDNRQRNAKRVENEKKHKQVLW